MKMLLRITLILAVLCFQTKHARAAGPDWIDGKIVFSYIVSCTSVIFPPLITVVGVDAVTGVYIDLENPPRVGEPFYARIFVAAIGDTCSGKHAFAPEFLLPEGVSIATGTASPIRCSAYDIMNKQSAALPTCPTKAVPGVWGGGSGWAILPNEDPLGGWTIPQGYAIALEVPLVSSRPLTPGNSNDLLRSAIKIVDGNSSPILYPESFLYVVDQNTATPLPTPEVSTPTVQPTPSVDPGSNNQDIGSTKPLLTLSISNVPKKVSRKALIKGFKITARSTTVPSFISVALWNSKKKVLFQKTQLPSPVTVALKVKASKLRVGQVLTLGIQSEAQGASSVMYTYTVKVS